MTNYLAHRTTLSILLLVLTAGFPETINAEESSTGNAEIAALKQQNIDLEKNAQAYRFTISKNEEQIKALREVNQVLANTLELTRQALNEAREKNQPPAKTPF